MKKKLLALLLLVPILLIPIISCEDGFLGGLTEVMGALSGNALLDTGVVAIDESHADAAIDITKDLKTATGDDYKALVDDLKDVIGDALSSPQKTEALKEKMKADVDEDNIPSHVKDLVEDLGGEIKTQGDLVAAILAVSFIEKVEDLLEGEDDFDWGSATAEDKQKAEELIGEAMEVLQVIEAISPTNAIGIRELMDAFGDFGRSRGTPRNGDDPDLDNLEPIVDMLIASIGVTNNKINRKNLNSMISNYGLMRATYERLARSLSGSRQELEENDALNYLLSVFFTEANKLFTEPEKKFADFIDTFLDYRGGNEDAFAGDKYKTELSNAETVVEELFEEGGTVRKTFDKLLGAISKSDSLMELLDGTGMFGEGE